MRRSDSSGPTGEEPTVCQADGPISPTAGVLRALERGSARYVELAPRAAGAQPFFVLEGGIEDADTPGTVRTAGAGASVSDATEVPDPLAAEPETPSVSLTLTDITLYPELQNAIAYYGPQTKSVRVRTHPSREQLLDTAIEALAGRLGTAFEYADRRFDLRVDRG